MKKLLLLLFILLGSSILSLSAQDFGSWSAYTSFRNVTGITTDSQNRVWTSTTGGILITDENGDQTQLTTIDGLFRQDGTAIIYDEVNNRIIIGYITGELNVIDAETLEITVLNDIARNQTFTTKSINHFQIDDNILYAATSFGVVEFNLNTLFVNDSYTKLGSNDRGVPVYKIKVDGDIIYAGTETGIAFGNMGDELSLSENWGNYNQSTGFTDDAIFALSVNQGEIKASSATQNYSFDGLNWQNETSFGNNIIQEYHLQDNGEIVALAPSSVYIQNGLSQYIFTPINTLSTKLHISEAGDILVGTVAFGFGQLLNQNSEFSLINAEGPFQNFFKNIKFDGNTLISGSTNTSSRNGFIDRGRGYYLLKDGVWENYNAINTPALSARNFVLGFTTTITEDYYYIGSWGSGIVRHQKDNNEIRVFDENNSTLRGWPADDENFPVISGLATDSFGDVWAVSRYAANPLYRQSPSDEDWQAFSPANAANNSDLYFNFFLDSRNYKWISLQSSTASGTGLLVIDTQNSENPDDDRSVKLTNDLSNGNLPDNDVKAIVEDKNGEVWIGTGRGIARFIFPEFIIDGSVEERRAQWLINEDTSAVSRFLLRDLNVTTMAVNAANEKWIGSENQGIWVLSPEGNRIIKRFTKENSPLFSNNIISISINDNTGEVFIATDLGLISYQDVARNPVQKMNELKVFPNPFEYNQHSQVIIENLGEATNIKVLGVDGTVITSFETQGGRASWNGLDSNGNKVGSGVYFIVAASQGESDSGRGIGKLVIIR